jgi:hypothetical protein
MIICLSLALFRSTSHLHKAESQEERDRIISQLEFLRKQFINLFELFNITDQVAVAYCSNQERERERDHLHLTLGCRAFRM